MIINFNNGDTIIDPYTPILWECLGFKFRNDDLIYKLNNFNKRHNPMTKHSTEDNTIYHLVYDDDNVSSLILKVSSNGTQQFVEDVFPISYSPLIPKYLIKLKNNDENKYFFTYFDNKNGKKLFSSFVNLPNFQVDMKRIDAEYDALVPNKEYIVSSYLLSTSAIIYKDEETLKEKLGDDESLFSDYNDCQDILSSIAGKVIFSNVHINSFTGLRFHEIGFICKNNQFVVYLPSNYLNKFPRIGDYIYCSHFSLFAEVRCLNDEKSKYKPNSHVDKKQYKLDESILTLKMQYLKGYENNIIKIKKDDIFDGDVKIKSLSVWLYKDKIKVNAEMYENGKPPISINIVKDGDFKMEIQKLKRLKIKPNHDFVEDLIDGVYWYAVYNDIYIEGHDNLPNTIEEIKKIIDFNEMIEALQKTYKNSLNDDKNKN